MSDVPFDLVDTKDSFTDTDWFNTCLKAQAPYVVVRSGAASADVLWDYVTLPPSCDAGLRSRFTALERDARAIFDRYAVADSYLRIKPTMICFDHLPFDQAKHAATELYGLIVSYLPAAQQGTEMTASQGSSVQGINDAQPHPFGSNRQLWVEHNDPSSSVA